MLLYFILKTDDLTQNLLDWSVESNPFTIRKNLDGSKLILKFYHDDIPLEILTLGVKPIEHKEMLIIVSSSEWQV